MCARGPERQRRIGDMTQPSPLLACEVLPSHVHCQRKRVPSLSLDESLGTLPGAFGSWIVSWVHRRGRGSRASPGPSPLGLVCRAATVSVPGQRGPGSTPAAGSPWESQLRPPRHWKAGQQGAWSASSVLFVASGLSLLRLLPVMSFLAMDRGTLSSGSLCHQSPSCLDSGVM